jgi:PAS domain S-box-containing protein
MKQKYDGLFIGLFNYTNDVIIITDQYGEVVDSNDKALLIFGSEIKGQRIQHMFDGLSEAVDSIKNIQVVQSIYINLKSKNGMKRPFKLTLVPVTKSDTIENLLIIGKDLTESESFSNEIEQLQEQLNSLMKENQLLKTQTDGDVESNQLTGALQKLEQANTQLNKMNKTLTKELELASHIQKSLVPHSYPEEKYLHIQSHFEPMGPVGGDYYDIIDFGEGKKGIILADVSGHGVSSAFIAAMLKISFINFAPGCFSPAEVLNNLNREYCRLIQTGDYVTAFYVIFDPINRTMVYSGAGHPMPLFLHGEKKTVEMLQSEGFFLGMFDGAVYTNTTIDFSPGDKYLVYTDGIIEAYSEEQDELFGIQRLLEAFKRHHKKPITQRLDAIIAEVKLFMQQSKFYDDLAMVAVDFKK